MKFWEAMKAMEEGKRVRSLLWDEKETISLKGDLIIDNLTGKQMPTKEQYVIFEHINESWEVIDGTLKEYDILTDELGNKYQINILGKRHLKVDEEYNPILIKVINENN